MSDDKLCLIIDENTPGTRVDPGGRKQTQAVKKATTPIFFLLPGYLGQSLS